MSRNVRRRWLLAFAAHVAGAFSAVLAAFVAVGGPSAAPAYAWPHCTRYAPPTPPDTYCSTNGIIAGYYCTSAKARRDENFVLLADARSWLLSYDDGRECADNSWVHGGYGTYGQTAGIEGYWYAECKVSSTVGGNCTTNWHD